MNSFSTPEYQGVWLNYSGQREAFRMSVQDYLQKNLPDPTGILVVNESGPHWQGTQKINLSYAHTVGAAILVFSFTHAVGVDVEPKSRVVDEPIELAKRFFHATEIEQLSKHPPTRHSGETLKLWVKKEAYAKFTRLGLAQTMKAAVPVNLNAKTLPVAPEGFLTCIVF